LNIRMEPSSHERILVESATHEERIDELHKEMAGVSDYRNNVIGKEIADMGAAKNVALPVNTPFADVLFPQDDERIRTRLVKRRSNHLCGACGWPFGTISAD